MATHDLEVLSPELFVGFNAAFDEGFSTIAPVFAEANIVTPVTSSSSENLYSWLGQAPQFREWVGSRHIKRMRSYAYRVPNVKYEDTIEVDQDEIDDASRMGDISMRIRAMGEAAATHPDELIFGLWNDGETELCYDGTPFFNASHPKEDGTTQSNLTGGAAAAWYLMDTTRFLRPMLWQVRRPYRIRTLTAGQSEHGFMRDTNLIGADARVAPGFGLWQYAHKSKATLDKAGFEAAFAAMQDLRSDKDRPMGVRPSVLMVPPSLRAAALEVVTAERDPAGATNINRNAVSAVVVNPYLT